MKQFYFLLICFFLWSSVYTQNSCLPQGIAFAHQYDIDAFQANYPGCTHIEGNVVVFGDDVFSLGGLSSIKSIGGYLYIGDPYWWTNLRNLDGLQGLTHVSAGITLQNNPFLRNIEGLSNVESLGTGSLHIIKNDSLTSLAGLEIGRAHV